MADRIVVMRDGLLVGEVDPAGASEEDVLAVAAGTAAVDDTDGAVA